MESSEAGSPRSLAERLQRVAADISRLRGWRRRLAAFVAGALSALALAPFYATPLLVVGFCLLVWLLDGIAPSQRKLRSAALTGWFFGLGYFLVGVYWMVFSFFVQADQFAWMAPIAVLAMPSFLGLFSAGAAVLAIVFWRPGWRRILVFAVAWSLFEYARGHVLTGLPWNLPGQAFAGLAVTAQTAAWWGAYGLSLIVVTLCAAPAATLSGAKAAFNGAIAAVAGFAVLLAVGAVRLAVTDAPDRSDAFVRIVQPNIAQRQKIDPARWSDNFAAHLTLTDGLPPDTRRVFVVWPENSVPVLNEVGDALAALGKSLPSNAVLIAGSVRRDTDDNDVQRFYNAIGVFAQTPRGRRAVAFYDKHHLVPFGEYLPLKNLLRAVGLSQLAPFEEGFTPGAGPRTLSVGGPSFSPLICYEAIFPGAIHPKDNRPEWLVTVTNDAWFGDTSGPRQHLDQARLRTIETGLPMARAANTGISALIDARGVYRERLKLYTSGRIDAALPAPLAPTLYARAGDAGFFALVLLFAGLAQIWRKYD